MTQEQDGMTKDVEIMLGNTKKALLAMAIPVLIANLVQSINNIIDSVWLTSIGVNAQAAVNVAFPFFFLMVGLGNGVGIGASQALARRIGAMDRKGANAVAAQAFVLTLAISIVLAAVFAIFAEPLLMIGGAASNMEASLAYSLPIFIGAPAILMGGLFSGLLRSEGAARRSMMIHVAGAGLNMIFDPIFIFGFGWGIAGAAIATIFSMFLPLIVSLYWYFGKKNTFIRIPLKGFKIDKHLDWDILRVGIPASMEMILMAVVAMAMNLIIEMVYPVVGVAVYGNGWKVIDMFFMPAMAIGFAIVPIAAAALGARKPEKVKEVYYLALKYGIIIMVAVSVFLAIFAQWVVIPFSYSELTADIGPMMVTFILMCTIFIPFTPLGYTSAGFFQAMGWGYKSLIGTCVLNFLRLPVCYWLALTVATLESLWAGIVAAEIIGSVFMGVWAIICVKKLLAGKYPKLLKKEDFVTE